MIRIYNTLTRRKELFAPLAGDRVGIYVCGVTVYDLTHIGHARSAIVFDVIRRYLIARGYRVRFVKNFTDVDDKIIRRANDEGIAPARVSERYVEAYRADMASLGVLPPDVEPKATEHVGRMIALIERLLACGLAYAVGGDVFFEVRKFPEYGKLSGKRLEELLAGSRVEIDERKRDPLDFALWKSAKPGEPVWTSPWGAGRPGWHIECSAMAMQYLGESFDIHGGGEDLVFPHHENEIAQSEGATGRPLARVWIHNGFVNLGAQKMSKSLGNTLAITELVRRHDREALRLYLLGAQYRHPVEFGDERVREAARALERLRAVIAEAGRAAGPDLFPDEPAVHTDPRPPWRRVLDALGDTPLGAQIVAACDEFEAAMDDDFNTPEALAALFGLARALQAHQDPTHPAPGAGFVVGARALLGMGRSLGLFERLPNVPGPAEPIRQAIEGLVARRDEARQRRDWKTADVLRDELAALGAIIEDTAQGTRWKWTPPR